MNLFERAHIFQAFDALKGFRELLLEQEYTKVKFKELSEDDLETLDYQIHHLEVGMMVTIIYFANNNYLKVSGILSKINLDTKVLQIVKTKINIPSIVNIEIENP